MLELREQFALTFLLEQYLNFPSEAYESSLWKGIVHQNYISAGLRKLFSLKIATPQLISRRLKAEFNVKFTPMQLRQLSQNNNYTNIKILKKKENYNGTN